MLAYRIRRRGRRAPKIPSNSARNLPILKGGSDTDQGDASALRGRSGRRGESTTGGDRGSKMVVERNGTRAGERHLVAMCGRLILVRGRDPATSRVTLDRPGAGRCAVPVSVDSLIRAPVINTLGA